MGMSQDVRATELNGSRQQEEILLLDDENDETNFKEALKGGPKLPETDPEVPQPTSKEDNNPDLPASKEGNTPELPLSSEEELEEEDDKREEKSDKETCKPDSIVPDDDSESESEDENAEGKKQGQNLNEQVSEVNNADGQSEDKEAEEKEDKNSNDEQEGDLEIVTDTGAAHTGKVDPNSEPKDFIGDEQSKPEEEVSSDEPSTDAAARQLNEAGLVPLKMRVSSKLQTPGNSVTILTPVNKEAEAVFPPSSSNLVKSPSFSDLKEIFEQDTDTSSKLQVSTRLAKSKLASPRKSPGKDDKHPETPNWIVTKAKGQLTVAEALMKTGKKTSAKKKAKQRSKLQPPKGRAVNFDG